MRKPPAFLPFADPFPRYDLSIFKVSRDGYNRRTLVVVATKMLTYAVFKNTGQVCLYLPF